MLTWGYNGSLLGPAIMLWLGKPATVTIHNWLPEAATLHWHGLAILDDVDGGPMARIESGATRQVTFTSEQPAATCWFHPHLHGKTDHQVAQGLAGLILPYSRHPVPHFVGKRQATRTARAGRI
nr:putative protein YacC [Candidatus Pantoea persica]